MITGDVTQIDLPTARRSGLIEAVEILQGVNGLAFVHFDESDVVRHHLVQRIIRAYDEHKTQAGGAAIVAAGAEAGRAVPAGRPKSRLRAQLSAIRISDCHPERIRRTCCRVSESTAGPSLRWG